MRQLKHLFLILTFYLLAYNLYAQVPDIQKVDKISGTFGEFVTISGSGFSDVKSELTVHFGSAKGQILNSSEFLIEVLAPAGTSYQHISVTNHQSKLTGYSKSYFNLAFHGNNFDELKIKESLTINGEAGLFDICNCDFNSDGLNDIATTRNTDDAGSTSITVYQNATQGSDFEIKFQRIDELNLNTGEGARNISCGDLNGDGKPDLVVGKGGGNADRIYVFKNMSDAGIAFESYITILLSENVTNSTTRRLKIHDLDRDGKPDIIMTDQGVGNIFIFGNKSESGNIFFPAEARQTLATGAGSLVGLDVADLNNDGKPEIVCNSDKSEIFLLPNESVAGTIKMGTPQVKSISGSNLVNLKIGDLDHDGDKDIAVTNLASNIYIFVNIGDDNNYSFGTPKSIETGRAPWGLDFGDLNGDGMVDIVVGTTEATDKLTALINTTSGSNLSYTPYMIGNADISFNLNVVDFSGDAKPDIGYINRGTNQLIFLRNTHCVISDISPKNPPAICSNNPVTLRTVPALKVNYTWNNTVTDQPITGDRTTDISQPGIYNVSITSAGDGCESISEVIEVIDGGDNLPPAVSITNPGVVCEGDDFKLTAQLVSDVNYVWRTPSGETFMGNELVVNSASIDDGGRYALVLGSVGCRADPVFEVVEISSIPFMEMSSTAGELFCEGTSNTLSVPYIPDGVYEWKLNNTIIAEVTGNSYTTTTSGTYTVSVINGFMCTGNSNAISIKQVKQPVASFSEVTRSCLNEEIQFENTSTYVPTEVPLFHWDFGDGTYSTDKNPIHTYQDVGDFRVILQVGYNNTTCNDTYEANLNVAAVSGLEIMANGAPVSNGFFNLCDGNDAELSVDAVDGQVAWSTGESTAKITISESGTYWVTSNNNTGCPSADEIEVKLVDNVEIVIISGNQRIESGESAQIGAKGAENYEWTPSESLDNPYISNPLASPLETTEYKVVGTNIYGCNDHGSVTVYVDEKITVSVDAPKAFTPNGDGQNDLWVIGNIDFFDSCPIRIFNRRGQNVYEANQYNNDWNGLLNGKELPEGAYYYIISCGANQVYTGHVTLLR